MFISSCWHYCMFYLRIVFYDEEKCNLAGTVLNQEKKFEENYRLKKNAQNDFDKITAIIT